MFCSGQIHVLDSELNGLGWHKRGDEPTELVTENHRLRQKLDSYKVKNAKLRKSCDKLYKDKQELMDKVTGHRLKVLQEAVDEMVLNGGPPPCWFTIPLQLSPESADWWNND